MQKLIAALVQAKVEFQPIKKDKLNPHFKRKYADLESILRAVEPALLINGLVVSQTLETNEQGTILVSTLWHESGESIKSVYLLPTTQDSQKFGSALTYARRYSLCALLNVAAEEDDDGNDAPKDSELDALMETTYKQFVALGMKGKEATEFLMQEFGVKHRSELSLDQMRELSKKLREELSERGKK